MKYKTRKGILLCNIAGQDVLIAAQKLQKEVPYIMKLNESGAFCWKKLEIGISEIDLCKAVREEFEISPDIYIENDIHELIKRLKDHNYIVEE